MKTRPKATVTVRFPFPMPADSSYDVRAVSKDDDLIEVVRDGQLIMTIAPSGEVRVNHAEINLLDEIEATS